MKIRILTQNPFSVGFGGVELQGTKYIENIKKLDSSIDICFFNWDEKEFDILHIIGIHSGINPYWIDVLKSKGVKIIVSSVFYIKPNSLFDYRRPIIYKLFSFIPFHIINWMKQLVNKADLILPNSGDEGKQLENIFGVNNDKIQILFNGVDDNFFDEIDENIFKTKYNLDKYILCVSHIEPRKNHLSLIKGFLEYKKENESNLKLVLLGDFRGNYFDYNNNIKILLKDNKDYIIHVNDLSANDDLFKSAYLGSKGHFLLSSLETPGLSNIEAGLCGTKLILGNCEPVKEYFGNYASYIDGKNIKQIKNEIKNIDINGIKNIDFSNFIRQNYSWEKIGDKLLKHYNEIGMRK